MGEAKEYPWNILLILFLDKLKYQSLNLFCVNSFFAFAIYVLVLLCFFIIADSFVCVHFIIFFSLYLLALIFNLY